MYITKFFHWEMGYMNSMDIQHDRAGFYLCWGCLVSDKHKETHESDVEMEEAGLREKEGRIGRESQEEGMVKQE